MKNVYLQENINLLHFYAELLLVSIFNSKIIRIFHSLLTLNVALQFEK